MTTRARRQRKWLNEQNTLLITAAQDSFTLTTTGFDKGETLVRMILGVSSTLDTDNILSKITLAVWVGQFGGIPTNIEADNPESFMLWDGYQQEVRASGGAPIVYRMYDLRGQRASRSDSDQVHFVARSSVAAVECRVDVWSRCLVLLP